MPVPEERTLSVCGLPLAARAWGDRDAPLLLALHGWLDNAGTFDGLAPALGDHYLVALDLPGHGRSAHYGPDHAANFIDALPVVHDVLDALGAETAALVGHSMGGGIAALYAGAVPERITRLALLEGLGPLTTAAEDAPAQAGRSLRARHAIHARRARVYATFDDAAARWRAVNPGLTDEALHALASRSIVEVDGGWAYAHDPRLRGTSLLRMTEPLVLAFLGAIACPTWVLRARNGLAFPKALAQARFAALQHATLHEVEGDHHVHLNAPERVSTALAAFLGAR